MARKRIILLLDGTWNDIDKGPTDTNIVRLRNLISENIPNLNPPPIDESLKKVTGFRSNSGFENIVYYERGVGTGAFDQFRGGAFGIGLGDNVRRAYKFLSYHYEPGDQIFVFGFSRGAFTARTLVGYIFAAGLLRRETCTPENEAVAWGFYATPPDDRFSGIWESLTSLVHDRQELRIACVGVFDTVGALGIPLGVFRALNRDKYGFHDVDLPSITDLNLHAVAIDEHRAPFEAALWRKPKFKRFTTRTEQVWFAGGHGDIGGSWIDESTRQQKAPHALDDIALDWMLKRVKGHYPDFPVPNFPIVDAQWKNVGTQWSGSRQHEMWRGIYTVLPFSLRSISNYPLNGLASDMKDVSYDRHADPIAEMVHVSALERIGLRVEIDAGSGVVMKTLYGPKNLMDVLHIIKDTYQDASFAHGIRVVKWDGAEFDPIEPDDCKSVLSIVSQAERRLAS